MKKDYDFCGYATKNDIKCSDGRTIKRDAFKENDGQRVPLVWNHKHDTPDNVIGHALLENRDDGVYAYCTFNNTLNGQDAKELVRHGDINSLSIYANKLKHQSSNVVHGVIREVSLVLAGANPEAFIDDVIKHGDEYSEGIIYMDQEIFLSHADNSKKENDNMANDKTIQDVIDTMNEEQKTALYAMIGMAIEENANVTHSDDMLHGDESIQEIVDTMTETQQTAMWTMVGMALEDAGNMTHGDYEGDNDMKFNIFDNGTITKAETLSHAEGETIVKNARSLGSLQAALTENEQVLKHGIDDVEYLFPEYTNLKPGAPELIDVDQNWVTALMNKAHKSPMSRIRTRQMDISQLSGSGKGYKTGDQKTEMGNSLLLKRTTDPTTIYIKDALNRDDILDITEFDVVAYQYGIMRIKLHESIATAIMLGDGRDVLDEDKIDETKIRPIWKDEELFTIHKTVDVEAMRTELQGTDTGANFGDNYIYAEAIVSAALHAREEYKGSGNLDFYCTSTIVNVMLLARDRNGRRIYSTKSELAAALNVNNIYEVEQFAGKVRADGGVQKSLLGIFVNMMDYNVGSVKGGEITKFSQFDIDFNKEKMLIETRLSGALTRVKSAIVLEEVVQG